MAEASLTPQNKPQNQSKPQSCLLKITVVGDPGTPMTKLMNCFKYKDPNHSARNSIIEFCVEVKEDNRIIYVEILNTDITGQNRIRDVEDDQYDAPGVMIVYDVTYKESFESVNFWLRDIMSYPRQGNNDVTIMMVGSCLEGDMVNRVISTERGQLYADEHGLLFTEVACDDVMRVNETFTKLIMETYYKQYPADQVTKGQNSLKSETKSKGSMFHWLARAFK